MNHDDPTGGTSTVLVPPASQLESDGSLAEPVGNVGAGVDSEAAAATSATVASPRATKRLGRLVWRTVVFAWKTFVGVLLCQTVLLSVLVMGWSYRLMQRWALKSWFRRSGQAASGVRFADFAAGDEATADHVHWPNWILAQGFGRRVWPSHAAHGDFHPQSSTSPRRSVTGVLGALTRGFRTNAKLGVQAIFNTWVLTLPACVLWNFAWYDGWNNSFNKGYEQAAVGPAVGLLGVVLFIAAMLYVPLAQARQAVTGQWRAFYDLPFIRGLIRRHWPSWVGLAALYAVLSVPVMVLLSVPTFHPQIEPSIETMSDSELVQYLNNYYFMATLLAVFPAVLLVRRAAARLYAKGVLAGVRSGEIDPAELSPFERSALGRLDLLPAGGPAGSPPHVVVRAISWTGRRAGTVCGVVLSSMLWFAVVAHIFIAQFFHYRPVAGWLNQALIQLPWFRFVPEHLGG